MATYQFRTWIWIEADSPEDALDVYDEMGKTLGVTRMYCHEWMDEDKAVQICYCQSHMVGLDY